MKHTVLASIASIMMLIASLAHAAGGNAAPFGMEVGVATQAQVKASIGAKSKLQDKGINKYTMGRMLGTDGAGLEVDGVQSVLFIFDKNDVLAGAILTMTKDPKGLYSMLSGKYKTVSNRIDNFMNFGYARLEKGDSWVEIDAPHLSFEMEVRYVTKALLAAFNQTSSQEEQTKQKNKASAL